MTRTPVALLLLAVVAATVLVVASGGGDGRRVEAEFTNARGLLVGNDVRVNGAKVGRVSEIELTDRNTALVTMALDDDAPPVRDDAVAAIRPVDLLGDIYLALSPGRSARPLDAPIRVAQTSNAPRLSDVLGVFRRPVRAGLQALLVELGTGLERRGADLNRAAVQLRPALDAFGRALREADSQTADLRGLVRAAGSMSRQLAAQNRALRASVSGLAGTLTPIAAADADLDGALRTAPGLLRRLEHTSGLLSRTARRGRPLAAGLRRAAPPLTDVLRRLASFLPDARTAVSQTRPALRTLTGVLTGGRTTFDRLAGGLGQTAQAAPRVTDLTAAVEPAAGDISDGFLRNFPDQAKESGTQPFDPFASPDRHYWKGAAVMTCESFGLPITPGCIDQYLPRRRSAGERPRPARPARPDTPAAAAPQAPRRPSLPQGLPGLKLPAVLAPVEDAVDAILAGTPVPLPSSAREDDVRDLLDYLLAP